MTTTAIASAFPHFWGYAPTPETGPLALPVNVLFGAGVTSVDIDLALESQNSVMPFVQSVWIDNADGPVRVWLETDVIKQRVSCPMFTQGARPLFVNNPPKFRAYTDGGADEFTVRFIFLNIPLGFFNAAAV